MVFDIDSFIYRILNRMKILVSWLALHNDFNAPDSVNTDGPTFNFHKFHFKEYSKHVLFATADTLNKQELLVLEMRKHFPKHVIEAQLISISDLGNLLEVKTKVEAHLLEYRKCDIDIFFSPGSSVMQLVWFICHGTLGLKTRLLQLRRPEHSIDPKHPDLFSINYRFSEGPVSAMIKQQRLNGKQADSGFFNANTLKPVYEKACKIAKTDNVTALITGASGSGKELIARYIHGESARSGKPFIAINCSAFSDDLLESRLFGHKKGAFTGAHTDSKGFIEQANGGTVFLDEIGDISPYMQQTLLRTMQEHEIHPVGGKPFTVDVRFITATNKNLMQLCDAEKFRLDLYYRLAVAVIEVPGLQQYPVNERKEMIKFFIRSKQKYFGRSKPLKINKEAFDLLLQYTFPGNIRELENLVESLYVFNDDEVTVNNLHSGYNVTDNSFSYNLADAEKRHINATLQAFNGNLKQTARALRIALNTLKSKIKKYEISIKS